MKPILRMLLVVVGLTLALFSASYAADALQDQYLSTQQDINNRITAACMKIQRLDENMRQFAEKGFTSDRYYKKMEADRKELSKDVQEAWKEKDKLKLDMLKHYNGKLPSRLQKKWNE